MANLDPDREKVALYLEDLEVGQRFMSGTHRIDEEQIRTFAEQFDPQPFHLDPEAATTTLFEGVVASGWHTAAITMRLLVDSGLPIAGGIVGAGGEIAWPNPVRPGAVLHVESEILELRPSRSRPDRGMATVRRETRNQLGEVVQLLVAKLVVPRRMQPEMPGAPPSQESGNGPHPRPPRSP
jgi:acyl dehydratase